MPAGPSGELILKEISEKKSKLIKVFNLDNTVLIDSVVQIANAKKQIESAKSAITPAKPDTPAKQAKDFKNEILGRSQVSSAATTSENPNPEKKPNKKVQKAPKDNMLVDPQSIALVTGIVQALATARSSTPKRR